MSYRTRLTTLAALFGLTACVAGPANMKGLVSSPPTESAAATSATVPMILDGGQILVEIDVDRPDGASVKALAVVNMGVPEVLLKQHLYRELAIDQGRPLSFRFGGLPVTVQAAGVDPVPETGDLERQLGPWFFAHKIDGALQAGMLQNYQLVLDYADRTVTLARPGTLQPEGIAVPIRVNDQTGLITVDAMVDGKPYPMVVDCGGAYSWVRGSTAATWLEAHPDWERAVGAVGPSNYNMLDYAFEKQGTVLRIPNLALDALPVRNVGMLGSGPLFGWPLDALFGEVFWDTWQKGAPEPVVGWLGANVLRHYRLTIDYANRMSYWLERSDLDPHELDQVGVDLVYRSGDYFVGAIVRKAGKDTVAGLAEGDRIIEIDGVAAHGRSRDAVLAALHGMPGDPRRLTVERDGKTMNVSTMVTAF